MCGDGGGIGQHSGLVAGISAQDLVALGRSGTAPFTVSHFLRNEHRKEVKRSAVILRALIAP